MREKSKPTEPPTQFELEADTARHRAGHQASIRVVLLAAGSFLLGAAATALWLRGLADHSSTGRGETPVQTLTALSDATKAVLGRLPGPVEVRFYSMLEPGAAGDSLRSFAEHVELMLQTYEQAGAGKLTVRRLVSDAYTNGAAAIADGIKPLNSENGNTSFLGIVVAQGERKKALPQLAPEWMDALEADLSRAIAQVCEAPAAENPSIAPQPTAAVAEEVKRILPNFASLSLQEGTRILREAALKKFKDAVTESQSQLQQAEQALSQAQSTGSAAEQQAAMQQLQKFQAQQNDRLKQIAADSQAQIEALRRLKEGAP